MAISPQVEVVGLRDLSRFLNRIDDGLAKELRPTLLDAARPIADEAKANAPRGETGKLADSVTVRATQRSATVKVGSKARVPYARPVHWGWPNRNITAQPFLFDAVEHRANEVRARLADGIFDLLARAQR